MFLFEALRELYSKFWKHLVKKQRESQPITTVFNWENVFIN